MLIRVEHETTLSYTEPVTDAVIEVRMSPPSNDDQTVSGYRLRVTPQVPTTSYCDGFGTRVDLTADLPVCNLPNCSGPVRSNPIAQTSTSWNLFVPVPTSMNAPHWTSSSPHCRANIDHLRREFRP